jgi:hypothetical protein
MTDSSLHETDIVAWADRQVEELRRLAEASITNNADWANVVEAIESAGRSALEGASSQRVHAAPVSEASPFTREDLRGPAFPSEDGRRRLRDIPLRDSGDTL